MSDQGGLKAGFETISKDGKMSSDDMKKWFKDAAVIGKDTGITETEVDAIVTKTCKDPKSIEFAELKECVDALAKAKKVEPKELIGKLEAACPKKSGKSGADQAGAKQCA